MRNKIFSLINLFGLAIGLAGCLLIFLFVKDELSYDHFHQNYAHLYRVNSYNKYEGKSQESSISNLPIGEVMQKEIPGVKTFVRFNAEHHLLKQGEKAFMEEIHHVESNFLEVFNFPLLQGNPKNALQSLNSIVITKEIAEKYFGTIQGVLGKTLFMEVKDKFQSLTITGIAANVPDNSSIKFKILLPFERIVKETEKEEYKWLNFFINTFVLLHPQTDPEAVSAKIPALVKKYAAGELVKIKKEFNEDITVNFGLQPLSTVHLNAKIDNGNGVSEANNPMYSYILSGIALFILAIACINFTNLSLAQSLPRAKEIGVRKVIGASRRQLIFQFLGEAFLLCFLATLVALVLAELALPFFNELSGKKLSFYYLDWTIPLGAICILLISALLAGFYPALVLSGFQPVKVLKGKQKIGNKNLFTKALVVVQFSLSVFLIIVMMAFYYQMNYVIDKYLGYKDENLIRISTGWGKGNRLLPLFKNELANHPDIELVSGRNGGITMSPFEFSEKKQDVVHYHIDEDFIPLMGIQLKEGRNFSKKFTSDSAKSVIVNETLVKTLGLKNPIGTEVRLPWRKEKRLKIVGVVKDFHFQSLHQKISPMVFQMFHDGFFGEIWVKAKPDKLTETTELLKKTWRKFEPYRPFDYQFAELINARQYEKDQRWQKIVTTSSFFAIFISLIGLVGLATLNITQRTKEIGIRKVLGASLQSLIWLLSNEFNRLVLLGIILAIPAAYYAINWWLQNFAYRISPGIGIFAFAGMLTLLIAFLAVCYQSVRVARTNPIESLRYE